MVGATPFKALHGNKRKALQSQSSEQIMLGYAEDGKAYKLMEVATRKCFIERSVQFEEDHLCDAPPSEAQEGINTLPLPFGDDYLLHVSDSNAEDQDQHDPTIHVKP